MFNFFKSKTNKTKIADNFDINQINSQYIQTLKEQINNLTLKEIQEKDFIDFPIINLLSKELIEDIKNFRYDYTTANNPCLNEDREMFEFHIFLYLKIQTYLKKKFWKDKSISHLIFNYKHYLNNSYNNNIFDHYLLYQTKNFFKTLDDQNFIIFFNKVKNDTSNSYINTFILHILKSRRNLIPFTLNDLKIIDFLDVEVKEITYLFLKYDLFEYQNLFKSFDNIYISLEQSRIKHMISRF